MSWIWLVYAAGVLVGLVRTDARWPARVGLSLLWPVGPLAFLITVAGLLGASLIAFPILGAIVIALALAIAVLA
jgi:hypothetical protein